MFGCHGHDKTGAKARDKMLDPTDGAIRENAGPPAYVPWSCEAKTKMRGLTMNAQWTFCAAPISAKAVRRDP
jgi:hypothetical protein